jgi:riboflavin biosynthesis pyrimidine reductase
VADLEPLDTLFERPDEVDIGLQGDAAAVYGRLTFPPHDGRPWVYANFVETIDGVVALDSPAHPGGGPISGSNRHDRFVMAILRAAADAVVVGAGTLRSVPRHVWTPAHVFPDLAEDFAALRDRLGKPPQPLNVLLTASGRLDGDFAVLAQRDAPVLVITTSMGAQALAGRRFEADVGIVAAGEGEEVTASAVLSALAARGATDLVLLEGGPSVMGDFFGAGLVDELFLTLAPQMAGRARGSRRPGIVEGRLLAPEDPRWADLASVKRAKDFLFLRYRFHRADEASSTDR